MSKIYKQVDLNCNIDNERKKGVWCCRGVCFNIKHTLLKKRTGPVRGCGSPGIHRVFPHVLLWGRRKCRHVVHPIANNKAPISHTVQYTRSLTHTLKHTRSKEEAGRGGKAEWSRGSCLTQSLILIGVHSSDKAAGRAVRSTRYSVLHRHRLCLEVFQQRVLTWGSTVKHDGVSKSVRGEQLGSLKGAKGSNRDRFYTSISVTSDNQ